MSNVPARGAAIVTGGTRGIGLGIAAALARDGWDLMLCGVRPQEQVENLLEQLRGHGHQAFYCRADLGVAADREALMAAARQQLGHLNLLVNNAGVAPTVRADILDAGEESFDRILNINLKGPYFLTQTAARWMVEQRRANSESECCIINISSMSATVASVNRGDYCISKAGVAMATRLWAVRLAEYGIPVYEVRPGIIRTDMTAGVTEKYDALIANGLLLEPRWGTPDDVGHAVCTLARGNLPYATGQVIVLDGGLTVPRL